MAELEKKKEVKLSEVKEGDFIDLEFTGKDEAGNIFETTSSEAAQNAGIYNPRAKYGPVLIVAGRKQVLEGLDEELLKSKVGEERAVKVLKSKAFGERDQNLISLVPLHEFKKHGINPQIGMPVELDGKHAVVRNISSGRVRVDFNHPLAGEDLTYSFKILRKIESPEEKVASAAKEFLNLSGVSKVTNGDASIDVGEKIVKDANYFLKKSQMVGFILAHIEQVKKVSVIETFVK